MNTTTIIRQIKEYMGAYGKAYTLLYLGAVAILTSCVMDDLYDTPHPDYGKIAVTAGNVRQYSYGNMFHIYSLSICDPSPV